MDISQDIPKIIEAVLEVDKRVIAIKVLEERNYDEGTRETLVLIKGADNDPNFNSIGLNMSKNIRQKLGKNSPYIVTLVNSLLYLDPEEGDVIYENL